MRSADRVIDLGWLQLYCWAYGSVNNYFGEKVLIDTDLKSQLSLSSLNTGISSFNAQEFMNILYYYEVKQFQSLNVANTRARTMFSGILFSPVRAMVSGHAEAHYKALKHETILSRDFSRTLLIFIDTAPQGILVAT